MNIKLTSSYYLLTMFVVENTEIPTELRKDALDIQKTLDWEDEGGDGESSASISQFIQCRKTPI